MSGELNATSSHQAGPTANVSNEMIKSTTFLRLATCSVLTFAAALQDLHLTNDLRQPYQCVLLHAAPQLALCCWISALLCCGSLHTGGLGGSHLHDCVCACSVPVKYLEGTRDDLPASHSADACIRELPPHPTIVFINPKSGGQMGKALAKMFGEVVGVVQVCSWLFPSVWLFHNNGLQMSHEQSVLKSSN